jgi:hypothetical protein
MTLVIDPEAKALAMLSAMAQRLLLLLFLPTTPPLEQSFIT